jgi:hypothetical protein
MSIMEHWNDQLPKAEGSQQCLRCLDASMTFTVTVTVTVTVASKREGHSGTSLDLNVNRFANEYAMPIRVYMHIYLNLLIELFQ